VPGPAGARSVHWGPVDETIVVIEDEAAIASAVANRLRSAGYRAEIAADGPSGVALVERLQPDLVVLDLMLPGLDGFDVCRQIQERRRVPVLMLTARDGEDDMLAGLARGADDYMTKPFSPRELVARVQAVLRRAATAPVAPAARLRVGDLEIEMDARRVRRAGVDARLTATEFDLVACLAHQPTTVLTREELLAQVWGYRDGYGARTVDSHVRAVRRKLGADVIRTVHSVGYALGEPGPVDGDANGHGPPDRAPAPAPGDGPVPA
jgi:DNA-binding response OmpR family regulator